MIYFPVKFKFWHQKTNPATDFSREHISEMMTKGPEDAFGPQDWF